MSNLTGVKSAKIAELLIEAQTGHTATPPETNPARPKLGTMIPTLKAVNEEVAAARDALDAAQTKLDSAEIAREQAIADEHARLEHEEDQRIAQLRDQLPNMKAAAIHDLQAFHDLVAGASGMYVGTVEDVNAFDATRIMTAWVQVSVARATTNRAREQVLSHDATRSKENFDRWDRQVDVWGRELDSALSHRHGGSLQAEEDDLEALAAVNASINEQSVAAPKQLRRDPAERSVPTPADLGVANPIHASMAATYDADKFAPLEFANEFQRAVNAAASTVARTLVPGRAR